jgi:hypothetical protein
MTRLATLASRLLVPLALVLHPALALAGAHTWDVAEVFSNADGTMQFVELFEANGTPGETGVGNQNLSSSSKSFNMGAGSVVGPTSNKRFLVATAAFAALPGAPTPDAIIPAGVLPFFFAVAGDTVSYGPYDSWAFGVVPTNGVDSLHRATGVGPNSPTNYAGVTGSVDASPPDAIPSLPLWGVALVTVLLAATAVALRTRSIGSA